MSPLFPPPASRKPGNPTYSSMRRMSHSAFTGGNQLIPSPPVDARFGNAGWGYPNISLLLATKRFRVTVGDVFLLRIG